MSILIPSTNAGEKYLIGCELSRTDDEIVAIAAGQCRNSTNVNDITVASALAVDISNNGANGLDTGSAANSTFYAVYVIGDSSQYNDAAGLLSTSGTAPTLPFGYDMFRRVGWVKTDGSADLLEFRQRGAGKDRWMWYDASIATDITAGASATYAAVDMSAGVPDLTVVGEVNIAATFTPTGADDPLHLRPGGSSATNGYAIMSGSAAGVVKIGNMVCPYDATSGIDYKVTGSAVALNVQAYLDQL